MKTPANPNHIKVFDNFIEPEDLKVLDDLCRSGANGWWHEKSVPTLDYANAATGKYKELCMEVWRSWGNPHAHPLLDKYMQKLKTMISYEAGHHLVPTFGFCRMETPVGGYCPGHTDSEGIGASGTHFLPEYSPLHVYEPNLIDMSANIYVNNDFEGGQLYFDQYDITIEHTPGQLVWFPGSHEYMHGVHEIKSGSPRWNIITHFARPKLVELHSIIHDLYSELTDEQKAKFPADWNVNTHMPRGARGNYDYDYLENDQNADNQ